MISVTKAIARTIASSPTFQKQSEPSRSFDAMLLYFNTSNPLRHGYTLLTKVAEAKRQFQMVEPLEASRKADLQAIREGLPPNLQLPKGVQLSD
jgi:hypothetical protein